MQDAAFPGKRYRCRNCCNYNACANCLDDAKRTHFPSEEHIFDFVPNPTMIRYNRYLLADCAKQLLLHRNAGSSERDPITGWTSDEASEIADQLSNLNTVGWREASKVLSEDDMNWPANPVDEKPDETLVPL